MPRFSFRPLRALALAATVAILPAALAACGDDDPVAPKIEDTTFAPALNVDLSQSTKLPSGVYYRDLVVGTGTTVELGQKLKVYYTGWLANGTPFDSTRPPSLPFRQPNGFNLGSGEVILGWDVGLVGAKVGGRRQLIIPPSAGYGNNQVGAIPARSILVFIVDIVSAA